MNLEHRLSKKYSFHNSITAHQYKKKINIFNCEIVSKLYCDFVQKSKFFKICQYGYKFGKKLMQCLKTNFKQVIRITFIFIEINKLI